MRPVETKWVRMTVSARVRVFVWDEVDSPSPARVSVVECLASPVRGGAKRSRAEGEAGGRAGERGGESKHGRGVKARELNHVTAERDGAERNPRAKEFFG